jgi:Fe-S oxidoreductase
MAQLGVEGYESDDVLYGCTTCNKCVLRCPRGVKIIDIVKSMRAMVAESGAAPAMLRTVAGSVHSNGNPWSEPREKRTAWMEGLDVPRFDGSQKYLLFVCCTSAYDPRGRQAAKALIKVLDAAQISYGVLDGTENCCSESIRKIGEEDLFISTASSNVKLFNDLGVKSIITTSPHCMYTFLNDYPELGGQWDVAHYTQVLADSLDSGDLEILHPLDAIVTYHDPCYLGRHSGVYQAPRTLLGAVAGAGLVEMGRNREDSLCCGGGGGRLWMETKPEWRFSDLRVREACGTGASILATACPYCISMLEDSRKTTGNEQVIEVKDLSELIAEAL